MIAKPDDCAFPMPETERFPTEWGLTKRELFAAMAMQGMCASECVTYHAADQDEPEIPSLAVKYADALLAELAKPQEGGAQ